MNADFLFIICGYLRLSASEISEIIYEIYSGVPNMPFGNAKQHV